MTVDLQTILGLPVLTQTINDVVGGVPNMLPAALLALTRPVEGNEATYFKHSQSRKTAKLTDYGGTPHNRAHTGLVEVPVQLMHSLEMQRHKPHTLLNLLDNNSPASLQRQTMGAAEIGRQVGEFGRLFSNLRLASIYSVLANGTIWFDAGGNLLPSAVGAARTVDFSVPAGNKTQLDALGDGSIIDASWGVAGTDIVGQIEAINNAALKLTGLPIRHALYGKNVKNYLFTNTALKDLIANNGSLNAAAAQGKVPDPLIDLTWWSVSGAFYEDNDGVNQSFFDDDAVVFLPDITRDWWEVLEGSLPIANLQGNLRGDAVAALADATLVNGLFSVAQVTGPVPATIEHFAGDTFLPTLMNPNAIFLGDVTP